MGVNETKGRSLLKVASFRILEVGIDTGILWVAVTYGQPLSPLKLLGISAFVESCCMGIHYIFERIWNKINYGRVLV
jgi:uncharacterized membrane protein